MQLTMPVSASSAPGKMNIQHFIETNSAVSEDDGQGEEVGVLDLLLQVCAGTRDWTRRTPCA